MLLSDWPYVIYLGSQGMVSKSWFAVVFTAMRRSMLQWTFQLVITKLGHRPLHSFVKTGTLYGRLKIGPLYGLLEIGSLYGSLKNGPLYSSLKIGPLYGSLKIGPLYG